MEQSRTEMSLEQPMNPFLRRRMELGRSRAEVAGKAHLSAMSVLRYETGLTVPSVRRMRQLAIGLDWTLDQVIEASRVAEQMQRAGEAAQAVES